MIEADGGQVWTLPEQLAQIVRGACTEEQLSGQAVQVVRVAGEVRSRCQRNAHRSEAYAFQIELGQCSGSYREDLQFVQTELPKDSVDSL